MNLTLSSLKQVNPSKLLSLVLAVGIAGFLAIVVFAGSATLYLVPATKTLGKNETFTVAVRVDTGGETVNAIQADLDYPDDKLQFISIDGDGSAFGIDADSYGGDGTVSISRGSIEPRTGDLLVANVTFKAKTGSGTAKVTFGDNSAVVRNSDSTNILSTTNGGTYALGGSTSPSPSPTNPPPSPVSPTNPPPSPVSPTNPPSTGSSGDNGSDGGGQTGGGQSETASSDSDESASVNKNDPEPELLYGNENRPGYVYLAIAIGTLLAVSLSSWLLIARLRRN